MGKEGYPLLFRLVRLPGIDPLIDRQHPRLLMEAALTYSYHFNGGSLPSCTPALRGPALRAQRLHAPHLSGVDSRGAPRAPLARFRISWGHGRPDRWREARASAFNGREPDEIAMTSRCGRWFLRGACPAIRAQRSLQASFGHGEARSSSSRR